MKEKFRTLEKEVTYEREPNIGGLLFPGWFIFIFAMVIIGLIIDGNSEKELLILLSGAFLGGAIAIFLYSLGEGREVKYRWVNRI